MTNSPTDPLGTVRKGRHLARQPQLDSRRVIPFKSYLKSCSKPLNVRFTVRTISLNFVTRKKCWAVLCTRHGTQHAEQFCAHGTQHSGQLWSNKQTYMTIIMLLMIWWQIHLHSHKNVELHNSIVTQPVTNFQPNIDGKKMCRYIYLPYRPSFPLASHKS